MEADASDGTSTRPAPLPVRFAQVFISPIRLFDGLGERPVWGAALVLGGVLVVAGIFAIPTDVWNEFVRAQLLETGQPIPEGVQLGGRLFRWFGVVGGVVFWFIWAFLLSGVVTFAFAFVLGDEVHYRQVLSAAAHCLLIPALGGLLVLPLRVMQRDPQLVLSVGTFLPFLEGYPAALLQSLDLFSLWAFGLLGVAVTRFDRRRSPAVAVTIVVGVFVGLMAVTAAFQR